jgi:hypothetical protein
MFDWRSRPLAEQLAKSLGGRVGSCFTSLGPLWRMARYCVTATYRGMKLEIYVRAPYVHIWVGNFRMRRSREIVFVVNRPDGIMLLHEPVANAFNHYDAPVFTRSGADAGGIRDYCRDPENERDIAALRLTKNESLLVNAWQLILRSKTHDSSAILERIDTLARLVERG